MVSRPLVWCYFGQYKTTSSFQDKPQKSPSTCLIFVIFLHRQNFWRIKFTPKNANFCQFFANFCQFTPKFAPKRANFCHFCIKSEKIYTGQKKFTQVPPVAPVTNMRYVSGMTSPLRASRKQWRLCIMYQIHSVAPS